MQRWIVAAVVLILLTVGGGAFAYRHYKQNKPTRVYVPVPLNPELPSEKREEVAAELKARLSEPGLLIQAVKDTGLAGKLKLASDEAAGRFVGERLFVETGEADTPMGLKVPALHIGMTCKVKEYTPMGEVALRLMDDVWKILGVNPPPKAQGP